VSCTALNRLFVSQGTLVQFITGNCYKSELHFRNIRVPAMNWTCVPNVAAW